METKITNNGAITLIEIEKDGRAVNAQNPVTRHELLPCLQELEVAGGELCLISGMPMWAVSAIAVKVKNLFSAVAQYDPRVEDGGGCVVIHSVSAKYQVGQVVPLE